MFTPDLDDLAKLDFLERIVYANTTTTMSDALSALRRPIEYSSARGLQQFLEVLQSTDRVYHVDYSDLPTPETLSIQDYIRDAQGQYLSVLFAEPNVQRNRMTIVARPATEPDTIAHYPFTSNEENKAYNIAGSGLTANLVDMTYTAASVTGVFGTALNFTGDRRLQITTDPALDNLAPLAFSLWIRPQSFVTGATIIGTTQWSLTMDSSGRLVFSETWDSNPGSWRSDSSIVLDQWNHVGFSYARDTIGANPAFWIDGDSSSVTETSTPAGARDDAGLDWAIGNDAAGANPAGSYLDDLRIFNANLTHQQAESLALSGG